MIDRSHMPYRPCVGVALFNAQGLVFLARRRPRPGARASDLEWQMPQGGIEREEDIVAAARRELAEETRATSVSLLGATQDWWRYDFPPYDGPPHKLSPFRGQEQRWVAFRFEGDDGEIDVLDPGGGELAEFSAWGWFPLADLPRMVVSYKRPVYEKVAAAFMHFARNA